MDEVFWTYFALRISLPWRSNYWIGHCEVSVPRDPIPPFPTLIKERKLTKYLYKSASYRILSLVGRDGMLQSTSPAAPLISFLHNQTVWSMWLSVDLNGCSFQPEIKEELKLWKSDLKYIPTKKKKKKQKNKMKVCKKTSPTDIYSFIWYPDIDGRSNKTREMSLWGQMLWERERGATKDEQNLECKVTILKSF